MRRINRYLALILTIATIATAGILTVSAKNIDTDTTVKTGASSTDVVVHYKSESVQPYIYYWNALPTNKEVAYPGAKMTSDSSQGSSWYTTTFSSTTKINLMFTDANGKQLSGELTRNKSGEFWYKGGKWYSVNPEKADNPETVDFREETIYFVITSRFYDGDTGNNVHCWDDKKANNPDSDPAWRGDFKGLADKLDYIKALGFTAVWITPVVENASGYDYHGYHAMDFSKVDARYESSNFDYQDLIDAAHAKGMKIVQDVVWNHSGNFGENYLCKMFTKQYNSIQDLATADSMVVDSDGPLAKNSPNYSSMNDDQKYQARLACMKSDAVDNKFMYHHDGAMSYESPSEQTGQMAGDCVDINTENQVVADYITDAYSQYVDMGVDAFRLDTEKHISRWTLNNAYFPAFTSNKNFFIFGEVCARVRDIWNHGIQSDSCPFYTWKESGAQTWSTTDWKKNYDYSVAYFSEKANPSSAPTSSNAFLNGTSYHTPDYSQWNGTSTIDFSVHWAFYRANDAFNMAKTEDAYFNDSTWNVMYVDSHDYAPDDCQTVRYNGGTQAWAENMDLMFTFRGIPCIYYGSEVEFQKGQVIDVGPNSPLSKTGRAYYGDYLEGNVTASGFSEYTASGTVASTLNSALSQHLMKLNKMRRAIPALQKGQYTADGNYASGNMAYIRRYTDASEGIDSLALVSISGGATFKNIPNGKYIDAVTGDTINVSNGTLNVPSIGQANMRVYVCCGSGFTGINGAVGSTNLTYLK